ncbi:unnamed protein product, partial [Polarella glacialis]
MFFLKGCCWFCCYLSLFCPFYLFFGALGREVPIRLASLHGGRCVSVAIQQQLLTALVALENRVPNVFSGDPEHFERVMSEGFAMVFNKDLAHNLLSMDLSGTPVFGLWLHFRSVATHRLELPFSSTEELADAFGLDLLPPGATSSS